jgi:hypothetical protein
MDDMRRGRFEQGASFAPFKTSVLYETFFIRYALAT